MAADSVAAMDENRRKFDSPKHFKKLSTVSISSINNEEDNDHAIENRATEKLYSRWLLEGPEPPRMLREIIMDLARESICSWRNKYFSSSSLYWERILLALQEIFPILVWGRHYSVSKFKNDFMAGLTIASLCIPQSIGYATLARLEPQYGLYTSVVPPVIYALMGSSRDIAVGPVAVVSLLLPSMIQKLVDPGVNPIAYRNLVLTATFFAGVFQASFGFFRLGFLVDFLSHATIVGFMAGAAVIIGLQQLKALLGLSHFTDKTNVVSVLKAVWNSVHQHPGSPFNFIIGFSFMSFILFARFLGKRNKRLYWVTAIAPLISVVLSTVIVFLSRADKHGVKIVRHVKGGLNPSSVHELQLINSPFLGEIAKVGLIVAIVALTEAIAVGRSFAEIRGYGLDGNKEMVAMGFMNIIGSFTSCYVATGSFSRSAVNFSGGCETLASNIVMAVTVLVCLEVLTKLLYYSPTAILASIILSALPGLIDLNAMSHIWKVDKLDFLACAGAFFGVLFASVEIGLLVAVTISFAKIILLSTRPGTETLGKIPGTTIFCDIQQYPMALQIPGIMIIRVKSSLLCFANANFVRERISMDVEGNAQKIVQHLILDMSNLMNIDTSGIESLDELHKSLTDQGIELAIANPRWQVIHKLKLTNFVGDIEERVFLTIGEAVKATSIGAKFPTNNIC